MPCSTPRPNPHKTRVRTEYVVLRTKGKDVQEWDYKPTERAAVKAKEVYQRVVWNDPSWKWQVMRRTTSETVL